MKNKIKFNLFVMWDIINIVFLMFRFSALCTVLLFFNISFVYLLPVTLVIDWGLFRFCVQTVYKLQLRTLQKDIEEQEKEGALLTPVKNEIIEKIGNEIGKYQLFQWGNRNGNKRIIVLQSDSLVGQYVGIPLYDDTSIIIVPSTFYPQHYSDRARLVHEFSHCVSHDLMIVLKLIFITTIFLYPMVAILCNGISFVSILTFFVALILYMFQGWLLPYQEIEANNKTLEIIGTLFGAKEQKKAAELFHDNLADELKKENQNNQKKAYRKSVLKLQLEFLDRYLKTGELIDQISPINQYISLSYWLLFALTTYSCMFTVTVVLIPWYAIIFAIALYVIVLVFLNLNYIRIWKKKRSVFQMIGLM